MFIIMPHGGRQQQQPLAHTRRGRSINAQLIRFTSASSLRERGIAVPSQAPGI
jgi:hypothetical protein